MPSGGGVEVWRLPLALIYAAQEGNLEIVTALLEHGADVNFYQGRPLQIAATNEWADVVQVLLTCGGDVYADGGILVRNAWEGLYTEDVRKIVIEWDCGTWQ